MKKILLLAFSLSFSIASQAQSFIPDSGNADTVSLGYISGTLVEVHNNIASANSTPVSLKWKVINRSFDAGWDASTSGVCDNSSCRSDVDALFASFNPEMSAPYTNRGLFDVQFAANNPAIGTKAIVTVRLTDTVANYTRTLTFIAYRAALGIGQTVKPENSIFIYPNPALDFVNVTYDAKAAVKTIAICNLIGKTVGIYNNVPRNKAKLDLNNIPAGIYFLRLMNEQGEVIAIRRLVHQ